VIVTKILM